MDINCRSKVKIFKKGDRVLCIATPAAGGISKGTIYTVDEFSYAGGMYSDSNAISVNEAIGTWFIGRFRYVNTFVGDRIKKEAIL